MVKVKWGQVLDYNNLDQPPLIEWINLGNGTMFRLFAFFSHGGLKRPRRGLVVALDRKGCFFFSLENKLSWGYVSEKLNLSESDGRIMADWLNVQLGFNVKQQGRYKDEHIKENEPYRLIGETYQTPLAPEIIYSGEYDEKSK
jgi:hypothetical protein